MKYRHVRVWATSVPMLFLQMNRILYLCIQRVGMTVPSLPSVPHTDECLFLVGSSTPPFWNQTREINRAKALVLFCPLCVEVSS